MEQIWTTSIGKQQGIDLLNAHAQWYCNDIEPTITYPFQNWADTGNNLWKQRNAENTAWIIRGKLSETYFGFIPSANLIGIVFDSTIPLDGVPGFLPALGAIYRRADYPYFWSCVQERCTIVTDEVWNTEKMYGLYSYGDGETTFRVPLVLDFVRGFDHTSGKTMGKWVEDTFQGHWHEVYNTHYSAASWTDNVGSNGPNRTQESSASDHYNEARIVRNPSKGDNMDPPRFGPETAPKHVLLPRYIYTGEVW